MVCADGQVDLGLHCPYMPEAKFSHDMARFIVFLVYTIFFLCTLQLQSAKRKKNAITTTDP